MIRAGLKFFVGFAAMLSLSAITASGQTTAASVQPLLNGQLVPTDVVAYQVQQYLSHRIPALPSPASAQAWTDEERKLKKHVLEDIAYHGWPQEWVESAPQFEQVGETISGNGYRLRKLRYQIVPGFQATAILYEPEKMSGRVPAILNLLGHDPLGPAAEYEQKRCINFAKQGIVALNLGWAGFGEMTAKGNDHDDAADLDLVGSNALGFFYLSMRRGLDYLATLPEVDPARLGVTGLSGGGWQTIVLSSLDDRVAVAVEVAGFGALQSNITHPIDTDEIEEDATDLTQDEDYTFLVAMRAPRPTLLIHNAEDTCCFRAALVKPYIYTPIKPFFGLFGKADALQWYENTDPGTHNYQLVNRRRAYSFFAEHFHMPPVNDEIFSSTEIRSPEQLAVGLPADNLTIRGLAKELAKTIARPEIPSSGEARNAWIAAQREKLNHVTRYAPVSVQNAWRLTNTRRLAIQTLGYRFDLSNGLSASGVWLQAIGAADDAPVTIVLNDKGYAASRDAVSWHVNRGEQVLALDLLFNGTMRPQVPNLSDWEMLAASSGDRPLGMEAAQLIAVARWLRANHADTKVQVETDGMRSAVIAAVAAAIDPNAFSGVTSGHGIKSLGYLLDAPEAYRTAPDLFCLDLYKYFDIDSIMAIAQPTNFTNTSPLP
jgi:dienelactone hydrolase